MTMTWRRELKLYMSRLFVIRILVEILVLIVYLALMIGVLSLAVVAGVNPDLHHVFILLVPYVLFQCIRTFTVYTLYPPNKRLWGWFKWLEDASLGFAGEGSVILCLRIIGAGLVVYGVGAFCWQVWTYLKYGAWYELSIMHFLSEDTVNRIENPTDWIGFAKLLSVVLHALPMSLTAILLGVLIFVVPKPSRYKSDLDDLV